MCETHPRSDCVRKIVVESGSDGLRHWRSYRRSLVEDFHLAFVERPGPLQAVAVTTDGDNTLASDDPLARHRVPLTALPRPPGLPLLALASCVP